MNTASTQLTNDLPFRGDAFIEGSFSAADGDVKVQTHNPADGLAALRFTAAGAGTASRTICHWVASGKGTFVLLCRPSSR